MEKHTLVSLLFVCVAAAGVLGQQQKGNVKVMYFCFEWNDFHLFYHFSCDNPQDKIHVLSTKVALKKAPVPANFCPSNPAGAGAIESCDFNITKLLRSRCQYQATCHALFRVSQTLPRESIQRLCPVDAGHMLMSTLYECIPQEGQTVPMGRVRNLHADASKPVQILSPLYPRNTNKLHVGCKIEFTPANGYKPKEITYNHKDYEVVSYTYGHLTCDYKLWVTSYNPRLSDWRTHEICANSEESMINSMEAGSGWQSTIYVEFRRYWARAEGRFWLKLEAVDQDHQPLQGDFFIQCKEGAWPTPTAPPTTTTTTTPRPAFDFTPFHFTVTSYEYHKFITDKKYSCEVKFYPDPGISMERFQFRYNVSRLETKIGSQLNSDGCFYKLKMTMFSVPLNKWVTEDVCTTNWGPWYRYHFAPAAMYVEFEQQDNRASGRFVSAFEVKTDTTAWKGLPLGKFTWHCSRGGLPIPNRPPTGDGPQPAGQKSLAYDLSYRHVFHTSLWQRDRLITLNYCQVSFWPKPGVSMDRLKFRYHIWVLQTMFPGEKDSSCSTNVSYTVFDQQLNDWTTDIRCESDFGPWVQYNRIPAIFYLWWGPKKPGVTGIMSTAIEVSSDEKTLAETGTFGWHCTDKEYRPHARRRWFGSYLMNVGGLLRAERFAETKDCTVKWLLLNSADSMKDLWFRYRVHYFQPTFDNGHDWCATRLFTLKIVMYDVTARKWRTHINNACQSLTGPWYRYNYPYGVKFEYHVKRGSKRYFRAFIKYKLVFEVWGDSDTALGRTIETCTTR